MIYLLNPLVKNSEMVSIDFNRQRKGLVGCPSVECISFDRCGEALIAGSSDNLASIFDVESGLRIRNLQCHSDSITAVSWNRSRAMPFIVATGSKDTSIVIHDVRQKFSIVNVLNSGNRGIVTNLQWSCNNSPEQMEISDPNKIYLSATSSKTINDGMVEIWTLKGLAERTGLSQTIPKFFEDSLTHISPIKAFCWNPLANGMFVTGGSTEVDSIIRLFDLN